MAKATTRKATKRKAATSKAIPLERVAKSWYTHVFIGLLAVAAGVLAISYPNITVPVIGLIFGINLFVYGVFSLAAGFDAVMPPVAGALRAIVGVLAIVVGLVLVARPVAGALALLFVIAVWLIIAGASDLIRGLSQGLWGAIVLGGVGVAAGIILLANPDIGATTLALIAGIAFIVRGLIELGAGFEAKKEGGLVA